MGGGAPNGGSPGAKLELLSQAGPSSVSAKHPLILRMSEKGRTTVILSKWMGNSHLIKVKPIVASLHLLNFRFQKPDPTYSSINSEGF